MSEFIFQLRRGTTSQWAASSRVLLLGEPGLDVDLNILKMGDGVSMWAALPVTGADNSSVADFVTEDGPTKDALSATIADAARPGPAATAGNTQRFLTKLYRGIEDPSALHITNSLGNETIEYVELAWQQIATRFPTHTFIIHGWDETGGAAYDTGSAGSARTIQTGTGPRTVHIWRAAIAGSRTDYFLGSRWQAGVVAPNPDLVVIGQGKNEGSLAAAGPIMWRGQYLALTEAVAAEHPYAGILLVLEPLNTGDNDMALKNRVYEEIAQLRGYGIINAHDAFLATGHPNDYIKSADGIHPTTSADAPKPNGSQLIADMLVAAMSLDIKTGSVRTQQTSSLSSSAPQLLPNGGFSAFSGATPDGWTVVGATTSKDVRAGYFESANGYGVRLQASGAAQSYMRGDIPLAPWKGKYITLAVRMRIPGGAGGTAGRISLTDGVTNVTSSAALSSARDGFHWKVLTIKVSSSAAYLRAIIYADTAANASADITVNAAYVVEGVLPRLGSEGVPGPSGPAGSGSLTAVDHLSTLGTNPMLALMATASIVQNTANQAILVPFKPARDMSIARLDWVCAVSSGNYDIGLYTAAGVKLWAKGSTAFPTANSLVTETVSPAVALTAGTTYYLVFTADNTTGSPRGVAGTVTAFGDLMRLADGTAYARLISSAFPLGSSITPGTTTIYRVPFVVFRES